MWVKEDTEFKDEILSNIEEKVLKDKLSQIHLQIHLLFLIYLEIGERDEDITPQKTALTGYNGRISALCNV